MSKKTVKKLTMSGFRSFADQVSIDLSGGSAVVLDSDSDAASDISAALCFLTDRPSDRMKSVSDIIFNGNSSRRQAPYAEVSLTIADGQDTKLVSRRMYSDGRSVFYTDGDECTRDDVRKSADRAGLYGYSVLDHNTVTDIVTSRYGSLSYMIEQASGLSETKEKIAEAETELAARRENLKSINSVYEECEEKKNSLQEEAIRAKDYRTLNEQLRTNEINIVLRKIEQCERSSYLDDIQIHELEQRIAENEEERSAKENTILGKKNRIRELDSEDFDNRDKSMGFMSGINDTKAEIDVVEGSINTITENIDVINSDCVSLRNKADSDRELLREFDKKGAEIAGNITNNRRKSEQNSDLLKKQKSALASLKNEEEEIKSQISIEQRNLAAVTAGYEGESRIARILNDQREGLINSIEAREDELPDEAVHRSDLRTIDSLEAKKDQLAVRRSSIVDEIGEQKKKISKLETKRELTFKNMNEERTRHDVLLDLDKNYEGYSESARILLDSSSINGIYGAVGELMTVRRGYEAVIERALGRNTESIICEDSQCVKEASLFLKSKNAGRLVFIPLKDINTSHVNVTEKFTGAEGYLGRALDFISFDAAYSKAFIFLLGNTVIFKTLKDAEAAGHIDGVRIVTLDNEILCEDGRIESGSTKEKESVIFERKNRLHESESRLYAYEKDFNNTDSDYKRACEELDVLEKNLSDTDGEIEQCSSDISAISNKSEIIGEKIKSVGKLISAMKNDLKRIENELEKRNSSLSELGKKKNSIEIAIRQLEQSYSDNYKKIESTEAKIRELKHEREDIGAEASNLENLKAANDSSCESIRNNIAAAEADIKSKEKNIEEVKEELASARRERDTLEQKCRIQEMNYTERSTALGKLREEIDDSRDEIDKLMSEKELLEKEYINFVTDKRALEVRKESSDAEAEGLKKEIWESYGISYAEALKNKEPVFVLSEGVRESGRIRNSLADLGEVNIGSVAELEKVKKDLEKLASRHSEEEEAVGRLEHEIVRMKVNSSSQFKNMFEAIDADFRKRFGAGNENLKARLRMTSNSETLENSGDIVVRRPAGKSRLIFREDDSVKTDAFIALAAALYGMAPASLVVVENVDRELGADGLRRLKEILEDNPDISYILITGDSKAAGGAENVYRFADNEDQTITLEKTDGSIPDGSAPEIADRQGE
ncbi:MAG: hypothetical protein ACOYJI_02955 [Anaerovoracaceae bacterium]|jgi:chromosome segregation protein